MKRPGKLQTAQLLMLAACATPAGSLWGGLRVYGVGFGWSEPQRSRLLDHVRDDVAQPQVIRIRDQHRLRVDRLAYKGRRVRHREANAANACGTISVGNGTACAMSTPIVPNIDATDPGAVDR